MSKLDDTNCELSLLNWMLVTPFVCAFSNFLSICPVLIFQTVSPPPSLPEASISLSLLKQRQSTASSISMKFSLAWYFRSFRILPVVKFHTSMNPSTEPETRYCPSGLNAADSMCDLLPNLICLESCVGYFSSSCSRIAALPRNRSICVPGGRRPWCCCHFSAWPSRANSLLGGTTLTSPARDWAMADRLF